jgi:hypothetical protein
MHRTSVRTAGLWIRRAEFTPAERQGDFMLVRVVLDTCTVRRHVNNRTPQLDLSLIKHKRVKVRLALSTLSILLR